MWFGDRERMYDLEEELESLEYQVGLKDEQIADLKNETEWKISELENQIIDLKRKNRSLKDRISDLLFEYK